MTKVIIEKVNNASASIIGKTCDSCTYSGDAGSREPIHGQTFITTDDVEENMTVRGEGKDTLIRKVEELDKVEVGVQLLKAENIAEGSSLATAVLRKVWWAAGKENPDMIEIFVEDGTNTEALGEIVGIADNLIRTEIGARAFGKWYPVANGKRAIIRIVRHINEKGKIVSSDADDTVL